MVGRRAPAVTVGATASVATAIVLGGTAAWAAGRYTLPELLELAYAGNAGLQAGGAATSAMEAQLSEARRSWMPSGELLSLVAPAPEILCVPETAPPAGVDPKTWRQEHCAATNVAEASVNLKGVFTRTEIRLVQPLFTFGKIGAGVAAAEAGVGVARHRQASQRADLALNVRRAYYGLKLAREVLSTLDEGMSYLEEAERKIEKDLADGTGTATVTDRLRLRTVRADAQARTLEARRLGQLAQGGLRALLGPDAPADLDLDEQPLDAVSVPERPLPHYEELARLHRPEARMLDLAVGAKRALATLERRRLYPDLVLLATASYAYASSIDNPRNAFANDPFNTLSGGLAAALRLPLDFGPRDARADRAAAEASEVEHRRREALGGIALEVQKAHGELGEAMERVKAIGRGERAGKAWITAVAQNFAVGLAETRDFADGLSAFFQMRVRYLQAVHDLNVAVAALVRATGAEGIAAR